jgi:hypothetical protein
MLYLRKEKEWEWECRKAGHRLPYKKTGHFIEKVKFRQKLGRDFVVIPITRFGKRNFQVERMAKVIGRKKKKKKGEMVKKT